MAIRVMRRACTLGAVLVSFAASAAYEYTASSDFCSVFGADVAGCKKPCSSGNTVTVNECKHDFTTDLGCGTDECMNNIFTFAKCTQNDPGPEEQPCNFGSNTDVFRTLTYREEPCGNAGNHVPTPPPTDNGACTSPRYIYTPCPVGACKTGPILGIITYPGKITCA